MTERNPMDLLTRQEVADHLKVSVSTVQNLYLAGHLPTIRIGRQVRIRWDDVCRFIDGKAPINREGMDAEDWATNPGTPSMFGGDE